MRNTTFIRPNARYRGPLESGDENRRRFAVQHDIKYLFEKLAIIKADTEKSFGDFYEAGRVRTMNMNYVNADNQYLKGGEPRV